MSTLVAGPGPLTGRVVSRYRVRERLGEGGMGVVYRAEDLRLGRPVALKFLRDDAGEGRSTLERFRREARAASALNHPHICTIHDVDLLDGRPFLVMELLEGTTLADRLREGPLPLGAFLEFALQLTDAVSAAHERGIVHRDLKPGNVFLTRDGRAKVVDFGIAKLEREASGLTTSVRGLGTALIEGVSEPMTTAGLVVGTLPYMAPEQIRDREADARSDLFSLGTVLYEMATGRRAFGGSSAHEVRDAIVDRTPLPPSRLERALPGALDRVILRALEKSPGDRYQTAGDMHASLLRLREDTIRAGPTGGGEAVASEPRRPPRVSRGDADSRPLH